MDENGVIIDGRAITLSTPDRLIWPLTGDTKAALVDYYTRIAPALLPHLAERAVTLRRFPEGVGGPSFFQSRCPPHPEWLTTATMHFPRTGKTFDAAVLDDVASLVWAANLATVEIHPYLHRISAPNCPSYVVFDLDPGPPAGLLDAARVALAVRDRLAADNLRSYAKSSGLKGVHVFVPLNSETTYHAAKAYARGVAEALSSSRNDVVHRMTKSLRSGKVLVDWGQNDAGKSTAVVYSLRGVPVPQASVPLTWDEIETAVRHEETTMLRFTVRTVLQRIEQLGDIFAPVLEMRQTLPSKETQS